MCPILWRFDFGFSWLWHVLSKACTLTFESCIIQAHILILTFYNMICIVTYIIAWKGSTLTRCLCCVPHAIYLPPSKVMLLYFKVWASTFKGFNPYYFFDPCHHLQSRSTYCKVDLPSLHLYLVLSFTFNFEYVTNVVASWSVNTCSLCNEWCYVNSSG